MGCNGIAPALDCFHCWVGIAFGPLPISKQESMAKQLKQLKTGWYNDNNNNNNNNNSNNNNNNNKNIIIITNNNNNNNNNNNFLKL